MKSWRAIANHNPSLSQRRERWFYLLISPWLLGLVLFQAGPLLGALFLSLADWPLPLPPTFVGLDNFRRLIADPLFRRSLVNTAYYASGVVPAGIALGLGLALLLNRPWRGISIFRAIFFLPAVISGVATILLWGWIFNPRYGIINAIITRFGMTGPGWLLDEYWAMPALILMSFWNIGINMVVFIAALQAVPQEVRDSALLDGAGKYAMFRYIIFPLISPMTFYLLIVNLIGAFQVFTPTYMLTRGGPDNATLTLPLYIYLNAFSWDRLGYASTLSLVLFLAILALTIVQFRLASKWVFYLSPAR